MHGNQKDSYHVVTSAGLIIPFITQELAVHQLVVSCLIACIVFISGCTTHRSRADVDSLDRMMLAIKHNEIGKEYQLGAAIPKMCGRTYPSSWRIVQYKNDEFPYSLLLTRTIPSGSGSSAEATDKYHDWIGIALLRIEPGEDVAYRVKRIASAMVVMSSSDSDRPEKVLQAKDSPSARPYDAGSLMQELDKY